MAANKASILTGSPPTDVSKQQPADTVISARNKAINTTELLENILLFLNLRTLLCSKRVSRQFRDVIDGSIKIQKALFFRPLSYPTAKETEAMTAWSSNATWNDQYQIYENEQLPKGVRSYMMINPLLDHLFDYDWAGLSHPDRRTVGTTCSLSNVCASWRRMFVFQPHAAPCYVFSEGKKLVFEQRSFGKGLRIDDLPELDSKAGAKHTSDPISVSVELHAGLDLSLGWFCERYLIKEHEDDTHRGTALSGITGHQILESSRQFDLDYVSSKLDCDEDGDHDGD